MKAIRGMSLRKKIALLLTVSVAVMALITWVSVYRLERRDLIAENTETLARYLNLFEEGVKERGAMGAQRLFPYWAKVYPDGRLTIIEADGEILYDSSADASEMENHYRRAEIAAALSSGEGHDVRYSRTLGTWYNYIARKVELGGGNEIVIRLSYPVDRLSTLAHTMGKSYLAALAASLLIIWLMSYITLRAIMRPLTSLSNAADSISMGEPARFPLSDGSEEIKKLSFALNSMYDSLQENIKREKQSKNELAALIEALPIGVLLVDRESRLRYINGTACKLCACEDRTDLTGSAAEVVLPSAEISSMLSGPDETRLVKVQRRRERRSLSVSVIEVESGRIVVMEDLTEKIRLDNARREFFVDAGHEFQTPLSIIRMGLELLKSDERFKGEEDQDTVDRLIKQQERITGLVDDLLLLVKLDIDPLKTDVEEIDLSELVAEAAGEARELPTALNVEVRERSIPEHGIAVIEGRRTDLERAVFNLVENGVKYVASLGESEGGTVEISMDETPDMWVIKIDDNGPGVPDSERDVIFDRFRRGEGHRARSKQSAGGYGLGLSISARIAERHGGSLRLSDFSELGGASFELSLPKKD